MGNFIPLTFLSAAFSLSNPFHVLQQHLLPAPVIQFCGSAIRVTGDPLSGFKGAVIFQKIGDASGSERVR